MTSERVIEARALYEGGETCATLGTRYGVEPATISTRLRDAGTKMRHGWAKYRVARWLDGKGRDFFFKSTWERSFAQHLDSLGKVWDYEPFSYELPECRKYTPDFIVYGEGKTVLEVLDVKGWLDDRTERRLREFRSCYPSEPFRLVGIKELVDLGLIERYYLKHPMAERQARFFAEMAFGS